jgi:hypothetical protein
MGTNLDKDQKPRVKVESFVNEPVALGKFVDKSTQDDDDDELNLDDVEESEEADEEEPESDAKESIADEIKDEEEEPKPKQETAKAPVPRIKKENQSLKDRAWKLQQENAELKKQLEAKKQADSEDELAKKYLDDGYDEKEAKAKAKSDVKQSTIEQQLEMLMFEKRNRRVLEQYPESDNDLERIMVASKASGMTVEQVCRGLYGDTQDIESERRAVKGIIGTDDAKQNASVAKSMRSAIPPKKSSLTQDQLRAKRLLEKSVNKGKPISDEDFLKCWET